MKHRSIFAPFWVLLLATSNSIAEQYDQAYGDASIMENSAPKYSPTKTKTSGYNRYPTYDANKMAYGEHNSQMSGGRSPKVSWAPGQKEGCMALPKIFNAKLVCVSSDGCRATCMEGYQFSGNKRDVQLQCDEGQWIIKGSEGVAPPECEPICLPVCQNNGICVQPGQCDCPDNFAGPQCQYENKPCLNNPPLPKNSRRKCTESACTITCQPGHQFPDGSSVANLVCKEGSWVPSKPGLHAIPDCRPTCTPECQNGGVCLSLNVCQCAREFRGPLCQYSTEVCAAKRLNFNGGYNCTGTMESLSCSLVCPDGQIFDSEPAKQYTCLYSVGMFQPQPIPKCIYHDSIENMFHQSYHTFPPDTMGKEEEDYDSSINSMNFQYRSSRTPTPGNCFTWGGAHYKTFDGKVYSFYAKCRHILLRDDKDNLFRIAIQNTEIGKILSIFIQDKEYTLESAGGGGVIFKSLKRVLPIPAQLTGFRVEMAGHMIQMSLESVGIKMKWDGNQFVQIEASESMWNRTAGLCGRIDGKPENDIMTSNGIVPKSISTLFDSWQVKRLGDDLCENTPMEQKSCASQSKNIMEDAEKFCTDLIRKSKFKACNNVMDISLLFETCKWDYCSCKNKSPQVCACDSLAVYVKQCVTQGVTSLKNWRDTDTCEMECTGGMMYQWCGPPIQMSCGSASYEVSNVMKPSNYSSNDKTCTEGCFCPTGTLFHNGKCVTKDRCPCRLKGKEYPAGTRIPKDCNTCVCENGEWVCTQVICGARCATIGDPHYQTFDGKRYNFMGKCSYTLLKGSNFSIESENVPCDGAISESLNLPPGNLWEKPSCTKTVSIKMKNSILQLKQNRVILINGKEIKKTPVRFLGMKISTVSSLFVKVVMQNGIEIWWDGLTRVYIDAPSSFQDKTQGLCGTFNANQQDDFLTPEGDIEQTVIPFANKWKTQEKCDDMGMKPETHPCITNIQNKEMAEKYCSKLRNQIFEECHSNVDVEPFYEDCMYDMCACKQPIERCLCPILGAYASECANRGVELQWRYNVKECELNCYGGQTYQVCADSCTRTCYDVAGEYADLADAAEEAKCRPQCVEGCNCPEGQTLDENGECIQIGSCPCWHGGLQFQPQYKEVRAGTKEQQLCTCVGATWECRPATKEEIKSFPRALDIKDKCSPANHEEFTTCEPEPITCKNMHQMPSQSTSLNCRPGCKCKTGYVFDSIVKKCIKPEECPCHHGGKSYADGQKMQEDCNTCECKGGKWSCEKRECPGVCSVWGDSHFKTFDGKKYDFQGVCSYVLVKGTTENPEDSFNIEIQNEVCGSSGVTCSKSITLNIGSGSTAEKIVFTKNKGLPDNNDLKRIKLRNSGLFIFAEVQSLNLIVQWDKGTRVYVKINPSWKGRMKGLCGNYNDNQGDDFQNPSSGIEPSAKLFGDSWKLQPNCAPIDIIHDSCTANPERKIWAIQKCGILKRYPFSACHSEVSPEGFIQRCEIDACACNLGGDCECLCTALAAYAHECSARGIPIKWRSQDMCPMQCDETCTNYSPCISTCPIETCDNTMVYSQESILCVEDTCVEGCERKKGCPAGHIYTNSSMEECVPKSQCKSPCMTLPNGKIVFEGDVVEEDECHSCRCSRSKKICTGQPCAPKVTQIPLEKMNEQKSICKSGWSSWINNVVPEEKNANTKSKQPYSVEIETVPSLLQLNNMNGAYCEADKITDIECRTVIGHKTAKQTGLEAQCTIEKGLFCRQPKAQPCPDFEIRIKCQCDLSPVNGTIVPIKSGICEGSQRFSKHSQDCSKFFECAPGMGPPEHPDVLEKKCSPGTWFNPHILTCDWPQNVLLIRPECDVKTTTEVYEYTPEEYDDSDGRALKPTKPLTNEELTKSVCDSGVPNREHHKDCALFYHCAPGMGPIEHPNVVLKTCGPNMLYNPKQMICDWPQAVIAMKPKCKPIKPAHPTIDNDSIIINENKNCSTGMIWKECAIDCLKVCHYYDKFLQIEGTCKKGIKCIPGCVSNDINTNCDDTFLWRDSKTCVDINDCTCRSHDGQPVKPGETFKESECEICQCYRNHYTCDKSSCETHQVVEPELDFDSDFIQGYTTEFYEAFDPHRSTVKPKAPFIGTARSSSTPFPKCKPEKYKKLLWGDIPLSDEAFSASSSMSNSFLPQYAKLNGTTTDKSGGSWMPKQSDTNQFIQVKLNDREKVYGVWMQGNPLMDYYVTSYKVAHSWSGDEFSEAKGKDGSPKIFRGPVNKNTPMKQIFDFPFNALYVKIIPLTWHEEIAVRFELIGCSKVIYEDSEDTSAIPPVHGLHTISPVFPSGVTSPDVSEDNCDSAMGIDKGVLPIKFVYASSAKINKPIEYVKLTEPKGWSPLTSSPNEWIMFDFITPRNLTGIITKGGPSGWVESFILSHSSDNYNWNPILNENGNDKIFPGNVNNKNTAFNKFERPIQARYLKVFPKTWKNNIEMSVEPLGCFKPYNITEDTMESVELGPQTVHGCDLCKGIDFPSHGCECRAPKAYDGHKCVLRAECPCVVGHMKYEIGAPYKTEDCQTCTCKLGGVPDCVKMSCPHCEAHLLAEPKANCECACVPCEEGKRLCPTSQICIPEYLWCNGVEDCSDDEINCPTTIQAEMTTEPTFVSTTVSLAEDLTKDCPTPTCPPGYKVVLKQTSNKLDSFNEDEYASDSLIAQPIKAARKSYMKYYKGGVKGGTRSGEKTLSRKARELPSKDKPKICGTWKCVSTRPPPALSLKKKDKPPPPCPTPKCPPNTKLKLLADETDEDDCPKYFCTPPPRRDAVCNMTGRSFVTFDGTEYDYDICDHILARNIDSLWKISVQKNCTKGICIHELTIDQDSDHVKLRSDLAIEYNGYQYTVDQTRKIGFQAQSFVVSKLGRTLFFVSTEYGFWVIYDKNGNIKIGVAGKLLETVDGLCGFFNDDEEDDKRTPDKKQAFSTENFGDSWTTKGSPISCDIHTCPVHLQEETWEICKAISDKSLKPCAKIMDFDTNRGRCLEDVCNCLQTHTKSEGNKKLGLTKAIKDKCICDSLQTYVTDCMAADQSLNIQGWRTAMNCPVLCHPPMIHYECFRRGCELSCENLQEENSCPVTPGVCFSGCFCPEGLVRKGSACVLPTECRDCVCDVFGKPELVTFDKRNFTFDGKCAYTVLRDKTDAKNSFEVYVDFESCSSESDEICTKSINMKFANHTMNIIKNGNDIKVVVDSMKVQKYPFVNRWLQLQGNPQKEINLLIAALSFEMSILSNNMAFTIKIPSNLYANKVEGLCGNCNGDQSDDLGKTNKAENYASELRAPKLVLEALEIEEKLCIEKPKNACWPLPPNIDPCIKLKNEHIFGKCHLVVDPTPYLTSCQNSLCSSSKEKSICSSIESYSRECVRQGICLDWRSEDFCPYSCENNMEYNPCGIACQLTCENYEKSKDPNFCTFSKTEGCYCKEGEVLVDGKCVHHSKCSPCDNDGHYAGDTWQTDECTECTCLEQGGVTCKTQTCAHDIACGKGLMKQELAKPDHQCCPEFICVPKPTAESLSCEVPTKISCSYGQNMKLDASPDKCPQYICQCKPSDECEPIDSNSQVEVLKPGMERIINSSGCCPRVEYVCKPEKCPKEKTCPAFHEKKADKSQGDCCTEFKCEPPKDKCIYDIEYDGSAKGGEIKKPNGAQTVTKNVGEEWQDGPCRTCNCKKTDNLIPRATCTKSQCPAVSVTKQEEFIVEMVGVPYQCCKKANYTACKHNGKVYEIGKTWESESNPCESFKCIQKSDGTLERQIQKKQCDQICQPGWKYVPSENKNVCCGECVANACIVKGVTYDINAKWTSPDHCINYMCVEEGSNLLVKSKEISCQAVPKDLQNDFDLKEVLEENKCCKKFIPIACKVDGKIYQEGSTWRSPDGDPCKNITCTRDAKGDLKKIENMESCNTDCPLGWEYQPSQDPHTCCGQCVQTTCIIGNKIYNPGEKWFSEDKCTEFSCDQLSNQLSITNKRESCPDISDCDPDSIYLKGCCNHCNLTALSQVKCGPEAMELEETIGLIQTVQASPRNVCINKKPIKGFKHCSGTCLSGMHYNTRTGDQDSICNCCQTTRLDQIIIELTCENGDVIKKSVKISAECDCLACKSASQTKTYTKTGLPSRYGKARISPEENLDDEIETFDLESRMLKK